VGVADGVGVRIGRVAVGVRGVEVRVGIAVDVAVTAAAMLVGSAGVGVAVTSALAVNMETKVAVGAWAASTPQLMMKSAARSKAPPAARGCFLCL
jgi:hypothetical protein